MEIMYPQVWSPLFENPLRFHKFVSLTGRSTGKTENFGRKLFEMVETTKQSAVIFRDKEKYIKDNIYRTMKRIAKEIGVDNKYKFPKGAPYKIISKDNKYCIDFFGIEDDPDKIKGYEPMNGKLCVIWFEEFGNLPDKSTIDAVSETASRFLIDDGVWLYSGNPPPEANSWARVWTNQVRSMNDYCVIDATFADCWELFTKQNKQKIIDSYLIDPEGWKQTYLGEPSNKAGNVYSNIHPDKHFITNLQQLDESIVAWALGVDVAIANDKFAVILEVKLANGRVITVKEFVHDPKAGNRIKLTMDKQADVLTEIYDTILKGIILGGKRVSLAGIPHKIIIDTQDFGLTQMLTDRGLPAQKVKRKSIVADIERGRTLIDRNMMYFVSDNCEHLLFEFENLTWKKDAQDAKIKTNDYGTVVTQKFVNGADDCENAWRYAHSWLTAGQIFTYVLDPLIDYYYKREIDIMDIKKNTNKGVTYNVQQ